MTTNGSHVPRHGGIHLAEIAALGLAPDQITDFSVNVNPYGPCSELRRAVYEAPIDRYPDPMAAPAQRAIAGWLGVPAETVIVGSGAVEILWALARATLERGDRILIAAPAFSEIRTAAERLGAHVVEHRARAEHDFAFDSATFDAALGDARPRVAYLATPGNPSGAIVPVHEIARLAEAHPTTQFVVDLSFQSLSTQHDDLVAHASSQVLWVRSLTKELSLPGLRIGFAVGPAPLIAALHAERPPWTVSAPAQTAAIAATTDAVRHFVNASRAQLIADRNRLTLGLTAMGLRVHPSETIYVLVDLGSRATGRELRRTLLERHRILIRDCSSFGLPHHVRLAARPASDADRLMSVLERELAR